MNVFDGEFVLAIPDEDTYDSNGKILMRDSFPFSGPLTELLTSGDRLIIDGILKRGRSIRHRGAAFVYVPNSGCWCHSRGPTSTKYINDVLGDENVSVGYHGSTLPYLNMLDRYSLNVRPIPKSICISVYRLNFEILEEETIFRTSHAIVPMRTDDYGAVELLMSAFCFMPINLGTVPKKMPNISMSSAEEVLSVTMDRRSIDVIMWCIGNSLQDPVMTPRLLFFYGIGGEGKTITMSTITSNLPGVVGTLTRDYVGRSVDKIDEADMEKMMENRFVSYGDVSIGYKGYINDSFLKIMSGNDSVSTKTMTGKLQCAGLFAMNAPWKAYKSVMMPWFARRAICLTIDKPSKGAKPPQESFSEEEILTFIHRCLLVRSYHKYVPIDAAILLRTLFGADLYQYCRGVTIDENASYMMNLVATYSISNCCGLDIKSLLRLTRSMCPSLLRGPTIDHVIDIEENPYVIAVRGIAAKLTEY
ncbi:unnamed protein product [Peronospora belbahrii]|uniref:SF3 helicase domain-containing protein n=1 Tax=Peronospora belbahrii TaxID=622444 RepID=A0ABN8CMY8_9STRA|nr:unnamed protein product [Peronospora belbahrii]